ncbi:MAG: hypothetical protein U0794_21420 [Isosphaeraceae bacterium]
MATYKNGASTAYSDVAGLTVANLPSASEVQLVQPESDEIGGRFDSLLANQSLTTARAQTVRFIRQEPEVASAVVASDRKSVDITFDDGLSPVLLTSPADDDPRSSQSPSPSSGRADCGRAADTCMPPLRRSVRAETPWRTSS